MQWPFFGSFRRSYLIPMWRWVFNPQYTLTDPALDEWGETA